MNDQELQSFLIRLKITKSPRVANAILILCAFIFFVIAGFVFNASRFEKIPSDIDPLTGKPARSLIEPPFPLP